MIYTYPISLDNSMTIQSTPASSLHFPKTNGYDGNKTRITNIVGYDNGDFLKVCPNCGKILPSEAFGLRITMDRDQSWCMDCR